MKLRISAISTKGHVAPAPYGSGNKRNFRVTHPRGCQGVTFSEDILADGAPGLRDWEGMPLHDFLVDMADLGWDCVEMHDPPVY